MAHSNSVFSRIRNHLGYTISDRFIGPINATLNAFRIRWARKPLKTPDDSFSGIAQIAQMPAEFDFPRESAAAWFSLLRPVAGRFRSPRAVSL